MDSTIKEELIYEVVQLSIGVESLQDATTMSSAISYSIATGDNPTLVYTNAVNGARAIEGRFAIDVNDQRIGITDGNRAVFCPHGAVKTFVHTLGANGISVTLPTSFGEVHDPDGRAIPHAAVLTLVFRSSKEFVTFRQSLIEQNYSDITPDSIPNTES